RLAASLLRGHVAGRAHDDAGLRLAAFDIETLGEAEVRDLEAEGGERRAGSQSRLLALCSVLSALRSLQEDVGWFQIPVNDAALVGGVYGAGERFDELGSVASGPWGAVELVG